MDKILHWIYNLKIYQKLTGNYFKDIPGYEGLYQINKMGVIKSLSKPKGWHNAKDRILNPVIKGKHKRVTLRKNNKGRGLYIHSLMIKTFRPDVEIKDNEVIDHIDNNTMNNRIANLRVVTKRFSNSKNKRKGSSSKYMGVHWSNRFNKWVATIHINKDDRYLGRFDKEYKASQTYKLAVQNIDQYETPKQFRILIRRKLNEI